jgi:hypothetical protein
MPAILGEFFTSEPGRTPLFCFLGQRKLGGFEAFTTAPQKVDEFGSVLFVFHGYAYHRYASVI